MIDYFALALSHGLLALAAWRLIMRADLDVDPLPDDGGEDDAPPPTPSPGEAQQAKPLRRA